MTGRIAQRLAELGLTLPQPATAIANYVPWVVAGSLVFVSGQLPMENGVLVAKGHLGANLDKDQGRHAARLCAVNLLAQAGAAAGGLDNIRRVVRLTAYIAGTPDFTDQSAVANGASDLMVEVLGEAGRHARVAVGVASLPLGAAVEIEGVFEIG